jgi:hypothetical protein
MAANITVCDLNEVAGVNPNGVYTLASQVNGKDSWERTVGAVTFSVQYFESLPTQEWHLIDKANPGAWPAIAGADNNKLPWEATWVDNGGYGIATVTEGDAGCSTCDPRFDMHAYGDECGEDRFCRLRLLGYV